MLTMPQEADFCGDRLRLSAFLRVVGNGMPKRPTRFRRRVPVTDDSLEPSTHFETTQEASTDAKTVFGKCLTKVPNVDPASSRVPEQPNSMSDNLFTAPEIDNEWVRNSRRCSNREIDSSIERTKPDCEDSNVQGASQSFKASEKATTACQ